MATQLGIYQHSLALLGSRRLASLSEDVERKRVLDSLWDEVVAYCLAQGMWDFAMRAQTLTQNGAGSFGRTYYYDKPVDLVHLFTIADNIKADPAFSYDFLDFGAKWYANAATIYVRYNSNHATEGGGLLSGWPQSFAFYVAARLAALSCVRLTGSAEFAARLSTIEGIEFERTLAIYSLSHTPGKLPYNVQARNPAQTDSPVGAERILPFYRGTRPLVPAGGGGGGNEGGSQ